MPGPKKNKGGKRVRRGKKNTETEQVKHVVTAEQDQEYARVVSLLGDSRLAVVTPDGIDRMAIIRGKFKKRCWINKNDIIVINLRGYQDDRADVIHKYQPNDVKQLVRKGIIPRSLLSEDALEEGGDDEGDYVAWAMPKDDDDGGDGDGGEGSEGEDNLESDDDNLSVKKVTGKGGKNNVPEKKPIKLPPPQREIKNVEDISDDSSEYDLEDL